MNKFLIILGCGLLLLGGIFLLKGNFNGEEVPFSSSPREILPEDETRPEETASGRVLGSTETDLPHEELIGRFVLAREQRDWREILRLRRWFASLRVERLLSLVEVMDKSDRGILLGQMFELAFRDSKDRHFRRKLSRVVMLSMEGRHMDVLSPKEVQETLHLTAVYGGANGASRLLSLLGSHGDPGVKQVAALALGKEASLSSISHLKLMADQVDLDLTGIYAIHALEKIGRRLATPFSDEEAVAWKASLLRTIEFDNDPLLVGESLVVLSRLHDRGSNEMLISLLKRESSSIELRRKALSLLAKEGTEEILEELDSLPQGGELSPEIEAVRAAIESRRRPQ